MFGLMARRSGALLATVSMAAVLSACGGGGGEGGTNVNVPYTLSLQAERLPDGTFKTRLPLNINNVQPGVNAATAPYTTTVYVNLDRGTQPIPSGDIS